uniref:Pellino FHA domain-containing protein n=1 Tax=Neolamprologus brichardi TaxID=32507 RepID=A0A3Q4GNU9_NEOBR
MRSSTQMLLVQPRSRLKHRGDRAFSVAAPRLDTRSTIDFIFHRHNGSLANGDKGRRRSRLALYKRPKANGVKPDVIHNVSTPLVSKVRNQFVILLSNSFYH